MKNELINKALTFEMVSYRNGKLIVDDFDGFDDEWREIINPIPSELAKILDELEEMDEEIDIYYTSDDI